MAADPAFDLERVRELTSLQRPLYAYIFSLTRNAADADDVLQETNRVICEKLPEYQAGTSFAAWAYKIAFFEVLTLRKQKHREAARFSDALVENLAGEVERVLDASSARRQALDTCLKRLPEHSRQLVARRYLQGADVRSVAAHLGRTEKAVYHALARVRTWLLECINARLAAEGLAAEGGAT
jgi:RNA polymerase sigma-70 factor (ECF subfamily)